MFDHNLFPRIELEDYIKEGVGRLYKCPDGQEYQSVTTRIGKYLEATGAHDYLHKWRLRVGDAEADHIMRIASIRGTIIHNICEQYVMNNNFWRKGIMPCHMENFVPIKKELDSHLKRVYNVEYPLFSARLKTAGRTDLIGMWDTKPSIIDYKTSKWLKEEKDIIGYFIQSACYAIMLNEMLGCNVRQIVIIISVDHEPDAQVFIKKVEDYRELVEKVFN
jgi:hypothetical protein